MRSSDHDGAGKINTGESRKTEWDISNHTTQNPHQDRPQVVLSEAQKQPQRIRLPDAPRRLRLHRRSHARCRPAREAFGPYAPDGGCWVLCGDAPVQQEAARAARALRRFDAGAAGGGCGIRLGCWRGAVAPFRVLRGDDAQEVRRALHRSHHRHLRGTQRGASRKLSVMQSNG